MGDIRTLYRDLIDAWNRRDAGAYAALVDDGGHVIGFDGSQMDGPGEIQASLAGIFANHPTGRYVSIVRGVDQLADDVAVLRAVAGMVPAGGKDIKPDVNAIQSLLAKRRDGRWRVALFQNTPAQFHGRPELADSLTRELRAALAASGG